MMNSRQRRAWLVLAAPLVLLTAGFAATLDDVDEPVEFNVGFGRTSFLNVNVTDAKVAFKVFTTNLGQVKGYDLDVAVRTYDSDRAFRDAVTSGTLQLVVMTAWEYLSADLHEHLEPRFLAIDSGYGPREYMLLVRDDSGIGSLGDLRGKRVALLENTNCEMSEHWIRTLLLDEQLDADGGFFGSVDVVTKPTQAVLPVFFGTADACVVSRPIFETMCELNPQLRRQLRSIAISEPLIDAVTFLAYDGWTTPQHRLDLIDALDTLHEDPRGMQILTLFKADRLAPFDDRFMDGTRALKARHDRLLVERERE